MPYAGDSGRESAALRCFTWRAVHCCGCGRPGDCLLLTPLPVHETRCPGEFGPDGRFRQHCGSEPAPGRPSSYSLHPAVLAAHVRQLRRSGWQSWEIRTRFSFGTVSDAA